MSPKAKRPGPTELCSALLPLVGMEVRASVRGGGQQLVTIFGRFGGSCEVEPLDRRALALEVDHQLIEVEFAALRGVRRLRTEEPGQPACIGVLIELAGGVSVEIRQETLWAESWF